MNLGYIVVEQEVNSASFYTVKYDFNFQNNVEEFKIYELSEDQLKEVELNGVIQTSYVRQSDKQEFTITVIKR